MKLIKEESYKIDLSWLRGKARETISEQIQKKLFAIGKKWCGGFYDDYNECDFIAEPYLYICDNLCWGDLKRTFDQKPFIELSVNQALSVDGWEEEKSDPYAELKKAYAEGKTIQVRPIQVRPINGLKWCDCPAPMWDNLNNYRIKPELKYRPWTKETCPWDKLKGAWLNNKTTDGMFAVTGLYPTSDNYVVSVFCYWKTFEELFETYTFEDGTPCGELVEK